jgi:dCMP deaminase
MTRYLVAYVPVLHEGYVRLFKKYGAHAALVGPDFVSEEFPRLIRDLRQVPVEEMKRAIEGLGIVETVDILNGERVREIMASGAEVTMPDEDVSRMLAEKYFPDNPVVYENVFLRWDKPITEREREVSPNRTISTDAFHREMISRAQEEAHKSADWWRQIGALAVKDGNVLFSNHNRYTPSDYNLFAYGNPRDNFDAGERPDIYTVLHGEAGLVAQAAKEGKSLAGSDIYVTTFPCTNCARLLAEAGVKRVYYRDGYSRLDAEDIFKTYGIEIILVRDPKEEDRTRSGE